MSTRAQVRFATREDGVSFSEHPEKIHAQFYVHGDGYPEGLGLDIAMSVLKNDPISGWEIEHVQTLHGDLEYIYYIWSDYDKETWISIFEDNSFAKPIITPKTMKNSILIYKSTEKLFHGFDFTKLPKNFYRKTVNFEFYPK